MNYFVVTDYWPSDYGYADIHEIRPLSVPGLEPGGGEPFPIEYPKITYVVGDIDALPPFFWAGVHLLMSGMAIEAVKRSGETHFQLLRTRVIDLAGIEDHTSYQRIHPLDRIDCLDRERSDFDIDHWDLKGVIPSHVRRLVLDEDRIPEGRHLFILKWHPLTIISEKLRDMFSEVGIPPIVFQPIEEYDSDEQYWPE